jgi:hypothetical protein
VYSDLTPNWYKVRGGWVCWGGGGGGGGGGEAGWLGTGGTRGQVCGEGGWSCGIDEVRQI